MLTSDLLISRRSGDTLIPKYLPLNAANLALATEQINCFENAVGISQGELDRRLLELEGDSPDYRLKRGLAHLLKNHFSTFAIRSPLEPQQLRERVFTYASQSAPLPVRCVLTLEKVASQLSQEELNQEILPQQIAQGLYADLEENRILSEFENPRPEALIHRYNLAQVQGIFYKASHIIINAYRNDPGEYKILFRYLKLFQLMTYIEGDADTGFTITVDGPVSVFKSSNRYGLALAKMIPALLHVSKWSLQAILEYKDSYSGEQKKERFSLNDECNLISHYPPGKAYDSMLEESFAQRWLQLKTEWKLEREVDLVPLPGGVMIPDFRLVHPDGRDFLLEIVGYWRPEYLQKKFSQVRRAAAQNLILAVSERLNLEKAKVNFNDLPNQIIWFKEKLSPKAVLEVLEVN
jgi:predicted nuclease of restriction endonuclease-like RecB superfamily